MTTPRYWDPNTSQWVPFVGIQGAQGVQGAQGPPGSSSLPGGTQGQALVKNSATNYDTIWSSEVQVHTGSTAPSPQNNFVVWVDTSTTAPGVGSPTGAAGGDLSGSYPNPTVMGIAGRVLNTSAVVGGGGSLIAYNGTSGQWNYTPSNPANQQGLVYTGSAWVPAAIVNQLTAGTGVQLSGGTGNVTVNANLGLQVQTNLISTSIAPLTTSLVIQLVLNPGTYFITAVVLVSSNVVGPCDILLYNGGAGTAGSGLHLGVANNWYQINHQYVIKVTAASTTVGYAVYHNIAGGTVTVHGTNSVAGWGGATTLSAFLTGP